MAYRRHGLFVVKGTAFRPHVTALKNRGFSTEGTEIRGNLSSHLTLPHLSGALDQELMGGYAGGAAHQEVHFY